MSKGMHRVTAGPATHQHAVWEFVVWTREEESNDAMRTNQTVPFGRAHGAKALDRG